MVKKKDKHGKAPGKLPKKIGRVKLPKDLRKAGDALIETASSPKGQQVIAAGLAIAASAATKRTRTARPQPTDAQRTPEPLVPPEPPVRPRPPVPTRPGEPGMSPELNQIVEAFSAATTAFIDGFFGRRR